MQWIDLSAHQVYLLPKKLPSGIVVLVLAGSVQEEAARALGFDKTPRDVWYTLKFSRPGGGLKPISVSTFLPFYPQAQIREMALEEVLGTTLQTQHEESDTHKIARDYRRLGTNHLGEAVYQDAVGRLIIRNNQPVYVQPSANNQPDFLLAGTRQHLDRKASFLCAQGYVRELAQGSEGTGTDIKDLYRLLTQTPTDTELTPQDYRQLFNLEASIESAVALEIRRLSLQHGMDASRLLNETAALDSRTPRLRIDDFENPDALERGFTPLLALAATHLAKTANKRILLPYAANGMVAGLVPKADSVTIMPDYRQSGLLDADLERLDGNVYIQAADLDKHNYAPESTDVMMMAAPITGNGGILDELPLNNPSHYESARALSTITMAGQAVVMFNGTQADLDNPPENQSVSSFLDWATRHYEVKNVLLLDPTLFGRRGEWRPAYLVYINGRRWTPGNYPHPEILTLHSRDELIEHLEKGVQQQLKTDHADIETLSYFLQQYNETHSKAGGVVLNDFQRPYVPMSQLGEPELAVPKNLLTPTRIAFNRYARKYGRPDENVESLLNVSQEELEKVYAPEQIDALALADAQIKSGRGMLIGDQTGTGKGRIIAGLLVSRIQQGQIPVFVTKTPDLFSDIYRDFEDIGQAEYFQPLLINDTTVVDMDGYPQHQFDRAAVERFTEDGVLPDGTTLILVTYQLLSQAAKHLNDRYHIRRRRPIEIDYPARRALRILEHAKGRLVVLDESHLATGDGAFYIATNQLKENAGEKLDSSATFMRDAKSLRLYRNLFPQSIDTPDLIRIVRRGGAPLQEVLSQMLVSDGVMLRREHNFSGTQISHLVDHSREPFHHLVANHVAKYMHKVNELKAQLQTYIEAMPKYISKHTDDNYRKLLQVRGELKRHFKTDDMGFANIAHQLAEQLVVALKQEHAADKAIEALNAGQKPIIAVNHTGSSLHDWLLPKASQKDLDGDLFNTDVTAPYPDIKDILRKATDRLMMIKLETHNEKTGRRRTFKEFNVLTDFPDHPLYQALTALVKDIHAVIDLVPDVPFAPLDYIRDRIEAAGYTVGEISGRKRMVVRRGNRALYMPINKHYSKTEERRRFNNGELDALLGTKAITTGNSLHSSRRFGDQRQRRLIEAQLMPVIHDRIQLFGRVSRRDQVSKPEIDSLSTGLPIEERMLAMSNENLKKMSASVTSNRQSAQAIETYDLFNKEGDDAVMRTLAREPDWMDIMQLSAGQVENMMKEASGTLARKVTGLMILMSVDDQTKMLNNIQKEYDYILQNEEGSLANSVRKGELDIKAKEIRRAHYQGTVKTHYDSEFDKPVDLIEIEFDIESNLPTPAKLQAEIARAENMMRVKGYITQDDEVLPRHLAYLQKQREDILGGYAARFNLDPDNLNEKAQGYLLYQSYVRDYDAFEKVIKHLRPGMIMGLGQTKVILDVRPPEKLERVLVSGAWQVRVLDLYWGTTSTSSLEQIAYFDTDKVRHYTPEDPINETLTLYANKKVPMTRILLGGNLFEASRIAVEDGLGRPVIYTDHHGQRHGAILCPMDTSWKDMLNRPSPFEDNDAALAYLLTRSKSLISTPGRYDPQVSIKIDYSEGNVVLSAPKTMFDSGSTFGDPLRHRFGNSRVETYSKVRDSMEMSIQEAINFGLIGHIRLHRGQIYSLVRDNRAVRQYQEDYKLGKATPLHEILTESGAVATQDEQIAAAEAVLADIRI